jgi:predicted nucleic-acid-binding Zn-ribbon protein
MNDELVDEKSGFECIKCGSNNFETFKASEI